MTTFHVMSSDRSMRFDSSFVDDVAVLTSFFGVDESASTSSNDSGSRERKNKSRNGKTSVSTEVAYKAESDTQTKIYEREFS